MYLLSPTSINVPVGHPIKYRMLWIYEFFFPKWFILARAKANSSTRSAESEEGLGASLPPQTLWDLGMLCKVLVSPIPHCLPVGPKCR